MLGCYIFDEFHKLYYPPLRVDRDHYKAYISSLLLIWEIYSKICTSIKGPLYTSDRSLEDGSSIITDTGWGLKPSSLINETKADRG